MIQIRCVFRGKKVQCEKTGSRNLLPEDAVLRRIRILLFPWRCYMLQYDFLDLGELSIPAKILVLGENDRYVTVPAKACLIRVGAEVILYDVGCSEGEQTWDLVIERRPDQYLAAQLQRFRLTLSDLTQVVISHSHPDHFGGIDLLDGIDVPIWIPKEDFDAGNYSYADKRYRPLTIGEEPELCEGVRILTLPGHKENLLGLLLTQGDLTILIQSDAAYSPLHLQTPLTYPGLSCDQAMYRRTVERILEMQRQGVEITFAHSPMIRGEWIEK